MLVGQNLQVGVVGIGGGRHCKVLVDYLLVRVVRLVGCRA